MKIDEISEKQLKELKKGARVDWNERGSPSSLSTLARRNVPQKGALSLRMNSSSSKAMKSRPSSLLGTNDIGAADSFDNKTDVPRDPDFDNRAMNELSENFDFDDFDFERLFRMIVEGKEEITRHFRDQAVSLEDFYDHMASETECIQSVLAVKMHVQINSMGEGFTEALDRLVSGEIAARQAFQDVFWRKDKEITETCLELATSIENISSATYDIFPVKTLVRLFTSQCERLHLITHRERQRRGHLASHQEIVGNPIIELLTIEYDELEKEKRDLYQSVLFNFATEFDLIMDAIQTKEDEHSYRKENFNDKESKDHKHEIERWRRELMILCKELQLKLGDLSDQLLDARKKWPKLDRKMEQILSKVADTLLEERWKQAENPPRPPRLFRGINPELANVLAGLIGFRSGIYVDQDGKLRPKEKFDLSDPFCHITDPGFSAELDEAVYDSDEDMPDPYSADPVKAKAFVKVPSVTNATVEYKQTDEEKSSSAPTSVVDAMKEAQQQKIKERIARIETDPKVPAADKQIAIEMLNKQLEDLNKLFDQATNETKIMAAAAEEPVSASGNDAIEAEKAAAEKQKQAIEDREHDLEAKHKAELAALEAKMKAAFEEELNRKLAIAVADSLNSRVDSPSAAPESKEDEEKKSDLDGTEVNQPKNFDDGDII